MKVIQIIPKLELAGAEIMCENLCYALKEKSVEVVVVSLFSCETAITKRIEEHGIPVVFLDKKRGLDLSMIIKLARLFKREQPDAVHSHINVLQYVYIAALLAGVKKCVHTVHSMADKEATPVRQKIYYLIFKSKRVVPVALSEEVKESIIKRYRLLDSRVPVIFNGIDLRKCLPKKEYSSKGDISFIHIGRFADVKNHEMLIDSFNDLYMQSPNVKLLLVGDGQNYERIRVKVSSLGLDDKVFFLGMQTNVYVFLHEADVFVLPSKYEGMPMTILEAMGTGMAIIATNVGGIPSMLTNNVNALLVDVDKEKLVDAMKTMMREDVRRKLGSAAKTQAEVFSSALMAEKYCTIYKENHSPCDFFYLKRW